MEYKVLDIIKSDAAVSPDDGNILFNSIYSSLFNNEKVEINFDEINYLTTAFLNNAIGQLYIKLNSEQLNKNLSILNLKSTDVKLLKRVIERAKITYKKVDIE